MMAFVYAANYQRPKVSDDSSAIYSYTHNTEMHTYVSKRAQPYILLHIYGTHPAEHAHGRSSERGG